MMTSTNKDDGRMSDANENLREVAALLFGDGAYDLFSKARRRSLDVIDGADAAAKTNDKGEQRLARVGQVTNGIAIAGGVHALGAAMANDKLENGGRASKAIYGAGKKFEHGMSKIPGAARATKWAAKPGNAGKLAGAAVGLHVAELAGDAISHKFLHDASKQPVAKGYISKMEPGGSDLHLPTGSLKQIATKKAIKVGAPHAKKAGRKARHAVLNSVPTLKQYPVKIAHREGVKKDAGFTFEGEFSKVDADKRQVFGWASIVEMNGEPVVDLQGDYIDIDEIEKSAYDYVIKSRKGGEMHRRSEDGQPVHASDMIESFIVTPEKIEKMGLPKSTPIGWWVGYQVNDDDAWNLVKSGKRTGFSIHGRGMRTPSEV